jgi:hypothetical protein
MQAHLVRRQRRALAARHRERQHGAPHQPGRRVRHAQPRQAEALPHSHRHALRVRILALLHLGAALQLQQRQRLRAERLHAQRGASAFTRRRRGGGQAQATVLSEPASQRRICHGAAIVRDHLFRSVRVAHLNAPRLGLAHAAVRHARGARQLVHEGTLRRAQLRREDNALQGGAPASAWQRARAACLRNADAPCGRQLPAPPRAALR